MIRLVTQFDPPSTRAAAATPTCGCCCCCSCLATLIGSSAYTAASVQATLRRAAPRVDGPRRWRSPWPGIVGAIALPISVVIWWTLVGWLLLWFVLVALAYRGAGHRRPWGHAGAVVGIGTAAFVAEFVVGGYMLANDTSGDDSLYLVGALVVGIAFAAMTVSKHGAR